MEGEGEAVSKSKRDYLSELLLHIHGAGLPPPQLEERFGGIDGTRRWRFDLAWPDSRTAVEYDGIFGDRTNSHLSIKGVMRDQEKLNEAQIKGWVVLRVNAATVDDGRALQWIEQALWRDRP